MIKNGQQSVLRIPVITIAIEIVVRCAFQDKVTQSHQVKLEKHAAVILLLKVLRFARFLIGLRVVRDIEVGTLRKLALCISLFLVGKGRCIC